jgi:hypothetical protein
MPVHLNAGGRNSAPRAPEKLMSSGDTTMRNLFWTVLAALLFVRAVISSEAAMAETVGLAKSPIPSTSIPEISSSARDTRLAGRAPIGHRQPRAVDVPSQKPNDLERIGDEDQAVDRKLTICRGC